MLHYILLLMTMLSCVNIIKSTNLKSPEFSDIVHVVGGHDCDKDYPFMVSLQRLDEGELYHFCGGSLLQQQWVLTAAHCVEDIIQLDPEIFAVIGYKNKTQAEGIPIDYAVIHPKYKSVKHGNDIAVVHLLNPVNTTEFINLPSKDIKNDIIKVCKACLIIGWGLRSETDKKLPEILQCAQMRVVSKHTCKQMISGISSGGLLQIVIPTFNFRGIVCVFGDKKSICFGDSGGPMLCGNVQYGIASYVIGGCKGHFPQVYTSVGSHLNFIYDTMNKGNSVSLNLMLLYIVLVLLKIN